MSRRLLRLSRGMSLSVRALLAHRLRAALAVVSVAAAVAAVVVTDGLSRGVRAEVLRGVEAMGTSDFVVVRPAAVKTFVARRAVRGRARTLRVSDLDALREIRGIAAAAPGIEAAGIAKANGLSFSTTVLGTSPEYLSIRRFTLARGRFLDAADEETASRVAVLGARVADGLFAGGDPVGQTLRVRGVPFDVVGVLAPRGGRADGSDEDNQVLVPARTALRRMRNVNWLSAVYVSLEDGPHRAEEEMREVLRERHRLGAKPDDFEVQSQSRMLAARREADRGVVLLTRGLSAVALVAGGAGIAALLFLSVRERTVEFGVRRAVGARGRDIVVQVLLEASLLGLSGWILGAALGALGAGALASATGWGAGAGLRSIAVALAMALATGLLAGVLPALAAARITPRAALASR